MNNPHNISDNPEQEENPPSTANSVTDNSGGRYIIPDEFVFKTSIFGSSNPLQYINVISLGLTVNHVNEEFHGRAMEILDTTKRWLPTSEYARKETELQLVASNQWKRLELALKEFGNELIYIQNIIQSYAGRADIRVHQEKKQIIEYFKSVAPSGLTRSAQKHMQSAIVKGAATIPVTKDVERFNTIIGKIQTTLSNIEEKIQWTSIEIQSAKAKEGVDLTSSDYISFHEIAEAIQGIPTQIGYIRTLQNQLRHTMFLKEKISPSEEKSLDTYITRLDGYMDILSRNV